MGVHVCAYGSKMWGGGVSVRNSTPHVWMNHSVDLCDAGVVEYIVAQERKYMDASLF